MISPEEPPVDPVPPGPRTRAWDAVATGRGAGVTQATVEPNAVLAVAAPSPVPATREAGTAVPGAAPTPSWAQATVPTLAIEDAFGRAGWGWLTRRRLALLILLALLAAVVVASGFLPWEWSFIDDGNFITNLRATHEAYGWWGGTWQYIQAGWSFDQGWGLFRPAFWVFVPFFYQLPVGAAHAVRVAMLLIAVGGAVVAVARRFAGKQQLAVAAWAAAALAADLSLYAGLYFPSLQELTGLCLIGLGLLTTRWRWLRLVAWLLAAWFKAPFGWLLLGYGLLLMRRRGSRLLGGVYAVLGAGTLGALALAAHTGYYAQGSLSFTPHVLIANLNNAVTAGAFAALALLAGAVLLSPRFTIGVWPLLPGRTRSSAPVADPAADPLAPAMILGGLGYLANLVFWHTDGYYSSGYVYLLTAGVLLAATRIGPMHPGRLLAGALVPALLGLLVMHSAEKATWDHNQTVVGLRDCLLRMPGAPVVGFNRPEGWLRLDFVVHERDKDWPGKVVLVGNGATTSTAVTPAVTRFDYYIHDPGYGPGTAALMSGPVVCTTPGATVYQVTQ